MSDTVSLSSKYFVAEGTDRSCYRHPDDPDHCVKVLHPERRPGRFWREINYYKSLQRRRADFSHLAGFRGLVDTSLGKGAIFELVRDADGQVSKSLPYYLAQENEHFNSQVTTEIESLKQYFFAQWIVFHDLNPTNILVKQLGLDKFRLIVIDGVGHNHFIPLASYSCSLARRKLTRVWNRRYRQWYADYPSVLHRLTPYLVN